MVAGGLEGPKAEVFTLHLVKMLGVIVNTLRSSAPADGIRVVLVS